MKAVLVVQAVTLKQKLIAQHILVSETSTSTKQGLWQRAQNKDLKRLGSPNCPPRLGPMF